METNNDKILPISFIKDFTQYIYIRTRQISFFIWAAGVGFTKAFTEIKFWSVRRMYWGRSSLYRSAFHVIIFSITLLSLLVGISQRVNFISANNDSGSLILSSGIIGNQDTLYQAGTTETITATNPNANNWPEYEHIVKNGETLKTIADEYNVSTATIKWANNLNSDTLRVNQKLKIPGLDGVLYTVQKGDTVASIVNSKIIQNANEFDIIELNELQGPSYSLAEGQQIFIPNAIKVPPPTRVNAVRTQRSGNYIDLSDPGIKVPSGTFVNPLLNCPGYRISRGVSAWHDGVDMAKKGGCWINATAGGVVTQAGWRPYGEGFMVKIDHQNGFVSYYFHGSGEFAVRSGQRVNAGQRIMYMGCTGRCTGTHLHFEMHYNGRVVNPMNYMRL